jgi:hypothetical protein
MTQPKALSRPHRGSPVLAAPILTTTSTPT